MNLWRVLLLAVFIFSCGPTARFVMRPLGMPAPVGECRVEFTSGSTNQVMARGLPLAIIGVSNPDPTWTENMKNAVRPRVCELGGGVASFAMATEDVGGTLRSAQIFVFSLPATPVSESPKTTEL